MYNHDGRVKNCIRSNETMPIGDLKHNTIEQIVLGDTNIKRQQQIKSRTAVPSCHTCKDLEGNKTGFDIISDRVFYIRELKKVPMDTYQTGNFDLQTIDIRWTNLCNFACVYCGPEFSSRWASDLGQYSESPTQDQLDNFRSYIYDRAPQLRHVYLAGGEPLLMKENLELLDRLDPNVNLRINTNLSKVDTRVFERVCEFSNVHWTVSAETVEQEYEYIRYGGSWADFDSNLSYIQQRGHKITFNMLWFLLNYESVFNFVDSMTARGFHANSFVIGALLRPEYLNIRHLPKNVLNSLKHMLDTRILSRPGYLLEDSYYNMRRYLDEPFEQNLPNSFQQLALLDRRRGLDSSKIFESLYKFKEE
jgi:sulfatase maturation enzyme AslB (radical SAM superfamily)